ncbi:hypothetical protein [Cupriavidus nantongensis]|uniref:Uncharacterized protein n=1 Tax=Cupriavidus nantongensis TaxID=1796606 RepID=A0A142JHS3_9BURK|nr:hypothetical protein [Cupriavidus nantongensis]AMR77635.1 hypothetical protein A2G96_07745 [Cupriavidus nantongensis]
MLELENQMVKILHVNVRNEKHGDEPVLGMDLRLRARVSNDSLAMFSTTLKSSFYHKDDSVQGDLVTTADHLPNLKNPKLGMQKWEGTWEHQLLTIHHKVKKEDDIKLDDVRVKKLVFDMQEGGTVFIDFTAQAHPDEKVSARLIALLGQEVHMSLTVDEDAQEEVED